MLLAISTTRPPATDLGFLPHKHPLQVRVPALRCAGGTALAGTVRLRPVGPSSPTAGAPTRLAVFTRAERTAGTAGSAA